MNRSSLVIVVLAGCVAQISSATEPTWPVDASSVRSSIDLNGEWEFKLDQMDEGRNQHWYDSAIPFDQAITVPGAWNAQGFGFESRELKDAYDAERRKELSFLYNLGTMDDRPESERLFSAYPGPAWYQRKVTIPSEWADRIPWLIFEGAHRYLDVWINGKHVATNNSYLAPLRIDLSQHAKAGDSIKITARVDARRNRAVDPLMGTMDTADFMYVNWGGLHRPVRLEAVSPTHLKDLFIVPNVSRSQAEVRVTVDGRSTKHLVLNIEFRDADGNVVATHQQPLTDVAQEQTVPIQIPNARLWSPKSPHLYDVTLQLLSQGELVDTISTQFGLRQLKTENDHFILNGRPIFLRGYGEVSTFPNTIAPHANKDEYKKRLGLAREYGFNYIRHHSWTPPEEYLQAADELGMMVQVELPFGYRNELPQTPEAKAAALVEWERLIQLRRNHPCIVTWCMGNELYDEHDFMQPMFRIAKRVDPSRLVLDTDGCHFAHQTRDSLEFLVIPFGEDHSIGFGDGKYDFPPDVSKPVIAHEMGYFVTLPDLSQLGQFEKGVRPYWLFQTRDIIEQRGLSDTYPKWLKASYHLQATCLKTNMEAARRSRLSGTSVWMFQDYPNCAEGVVNMFLEEKGVTAAEFRKYNAPTVLLLDVASRSWWSGQNAPINIVVSRFEDVASDSACVKWKLFNGSTTFGSGKIDDLKVSSDGVQTLAKIDMSFPDVSAPERLTLAVELTDENGTAANEWNFWIYPRNLLKDPPEGVFRSHVAQQIYSGSDDGSKPAGNQLVVCDEMSPDILEQLIDGANVVLLNPESSLPTEPTNFRLSSWNGGGPTGTVIDVSHPAIQSMRCDDWCELQFYHLIQGSKTIQLDEVGILVTPIVRCIDRPNRLANRAYLFEATVGKGRLLVSSFNFENVLRSQDPAGIYLFDQLVRYGSGQQFAPKASLDEKVLANFAKK